jgi:hypothetical protein
MRHTDLLIALLLASLPLFAQANPQELLHDAFVLEHQGEFATAINQVKLAWTH